MSQPEANTLKKAYPWTNPTNPPLSCAPMLNIATPRLATSVSAAGGIGFIAGGYDVSNLESQLSDAASQMQTLDESNPARHFYTETNILPLGVGFLNWGADRESAMNALKKHRPAAVWLFAPRVLPDDLVEWVEEIKDLNEHSSEGTNNGIKTQVWIQVGTTHEATTALTNLHPDVLVVQGSDAGGHGLAHAASIVTLIPEIRHLILQTPSFGDIPILAAGGIVNGRTLAAALSLGANGAVMGTRFLACEEAKVPPGYQAEILRASDGGVSTVRSTVYDRVRGIHGWPARYDGRGVINRSYTDATSGMSDEENRGLYQLEMRKGDDGWGPQGRMTTYAGTGVGLVKEVLSAQEILGMVWEEMRRVVADLGVWR